MRTKGEPAELPKLPRNCFSTATSFSFDSRAKELNQLGLLLVEPEGHKAGERGWRKLEEEDHCVLAALGYQMGSAELFILTLPTALGLFQSRETKWVRNTWPRAKLRGA